FSFAFPIPLSAFPLHEFQHYAAQAPLSADLFSTVEHSHDSFRLVRRVPCQNRFLPCADENHLEWLSSSISH
ncbi:hypothetical protein, partial [Bacillus subtilis]|uniref:hypothetical protein n=1 Tax=Bacillus subtilis TaxID=1423 RepID=UPI003EB9CFDD